MKKLIFIVFVAFSCGKPNIPEKSYEIVDTINVDETAFSKNYDVVIKIDTSYYFAVLENDEIKKIGNKIEQNYIK